MTHEAPAARPLTMSPEYVIPPSESTGSPFRAATSATSGMAVGWATPTPAINRVVQVDPGPTPVFTAKTPALMRASVPSAVATFSPIRGIPGKVRLSSLMASKTILECP